MSSTDMVSPGGGRRTSLRLHQQQNGEEGSVELESTEDMQQGEEEHPNDAQKKQEKDAFDLERHQLAEMVRDNYPVLISEDRVQKDEAWQNIYEDCKNGLNHKWAQEKDCTYLRKSLWPNMKHKAQARHGKSNESELDKFVYAFLTSPMKNTKQAEGDGEESSEKKTTPVTPPPLMSKRKSAASLVGTGRGPSRRSQRVSHPKLLDVQSTPFASPLNFTPPESRQSSQLSSTNTESGMAMGGTSTRQNRALKRKASQELAEGNINSSSSNGELDEGMPMAGSGSKTEFSGLEKELLQARVKVCEAKTNVLRLEKALWEEMLKKGKMAKMHE